MAIFKFRIEGSADMLLWASALDSFGIGCIGGVTAGEVAEYCLEDGYALKFGFVTKIHPTVTIFDYTDLEHMFEAVDDHKEVTYDEFIKEMK